MKHIVGLKNTLSQVNPSEPKIIDGFGNYNLEIGGVKGSTFENKSVLNLYFLDSGDYSTVPSISGYGWIKVSQQYWFQLTSAKLQVLVSLVYLLPINGTNFFEVLTITVYLKKKIKKIPFYLAERIQEQAPSSESICTGACIFSHPIARIC